jgi:transcriptional regulator with XRE-family HTH domain
MSFGKTLQRLREKAGLSQSGLAAASGIPVKTIQNWEGDRARPRLEVLSKLASALGASLDDLVNFEQVDQKRPRKRK